MTKRNAPSDAPPWASLAHFMATERRRSPERIAQLLDGEGWDVTAEEVQAVLVQRQAEDLARRLDRRRGR
jgi:hypothetical protein